MLAARGLITIKKGKGMYVSDFSSQNVVEPLKLYLHFQGNNLHSVDVIEARMMIEPAIAFYAAQNRTVEDARESAIIWHKKILNAIIEGDPEKAQSQMKKHLEIAIEHTRKMISIEKQNI